MRFFPAFILAASLLGHVPAAPAQEARVVAFGDSTTAPRQGLVVYATLLERRLAEAGLPNVRVINAGVGGNTTAMAAKRFDREVLEAWPALVIIQFGINDSTVDVWKSPPASAPRVSLDQYRANLRHFVEASRAAGARVILMTPNPLHWSPGMLARYGRPPYDRDDPDGFNRTLVTYAAAVRDLARELAVPLVDVAQAHAASGSASAGLLLADGMHPNQRGQDLVAGLLADLILGQRLLSAPVPPLPEK